MKEKNIDLAKLGDYDDWNDFRQKEKSEYERRKCWFEPNGDDELIKLYECKSYFQTRHYEFTLKSHSSGNGVKRQRTEGVQREHRHAYDIMEMLRDSDPEGKLAVVMTAARIKEMNRIGRQEGREVNMFNNSIRSDHPEVKKNPIILEGVCENTDKNYFEKVGIVPNKMKYEFKPDADIVIWDKESRRNTSMFSIRSSPKDSNLRDQVASCASIMEAHPNITTWAINKDSARWFDSQNPKNNDDSFRSVLEVAIKYGVPVYTDYEHTWQLLKRYREFPLMTKVDLHKDFRNWIIGKYYS